MSLSVARFEERNGANLKLHPLHLLFALSLGQKTEHSLQLVHEERITAMKYRIALVLCSIFATALLCRAQGLGTIVGTVSDPSGASIPSAQITVTQTGTGVSRQVTANSEGYYVIPSLVPSSYSLEVKASGFRESKQDITLLADQTLTVNVGLQVGKISEVVEVPATAVQGIPRPPL